MNNNLYKTILISIIFAVTACNLGKNNTTQKTNNMEPINKNAPFYTNQLPAGSPRLTKMYDSTKSESAFPFILYKDGSYMISVECHDAKVYLTYGVLFEKYQKGAGGFSWASLIKLILKKENPELRAHLSFDPEGGGFYVFADSEETQRIFFNLMGKVFKDTGTVEEYFKNANDMDFQYNPSN